MGNLLSRVSILVELLLLFLLLVAGPVVVLSLFYHADVPTPVWLTLGTGIVLFGALLVFLLRRRILVPLKRFQENLEDISEGFIIEEIPMHIFEKAEDGITDAFHKVIQINKMLMKNVDNLERGFEEERLAKLAQAQLTRAYERFVPHEFLSFLNKDSITEVQLGDHVETKMTVLFSDIRAFTTLSEQITTEENFRFLTSYLKRMEPVVKQHNGFIDKYIGDAIMALFQGSPDHAVQAGIEMLEQLRLYNEGRVAAGKQPIAIGIGLNTGPLMLGIVGGENRMEGTVISDAVNLASRVEDLNKLYGTSLLISENTYDALEDPSRYRIRAIDLVQVKGKTERVLMYEVFDADPEALLQGKLRTRELFEQAVGLFHQDAVASAEGLFAQCLADAPSDSVAELYRKRCEYFKKYAAHEADHQTLAGGSR